ncbi:MAG: hypothetical protein IKG01_14675 [Lachnospiraceae bacterium]|nr:hypothetical protein [Lachnospiraceae bacterium]
MTVKELKEELEYYEDDMEVVFEVCDDFEPDSVTEDRWGNREVHLNTKVKPTFICEVQGDMQIELGRIR